MTAIRLGTATCIRAFQALSSSLSSRKSPLKHHIDLEALGDEFGRFRVWSGNLGALQKGHSSLDYRLRDSPLLSLNVLKFLSELDTNLSEAITVLSGARLPYEQQPKPEGGDESDDDFYSEDEDDEPEERTPRTELGQRFLDIVDIIDNLYRLSVRIRSPTLRSRSLKAASFRPVDPDTGVDILEQYARYDMLHTKQLIRSLREPDQATELKDDDYLLERLSRAITLRRRQFKYWRRHRDKLGVVTVPDDAPLESSQSVLPPDLQRHESLEVRLGETPVLIPKAAATEKTHKSLLSGTEATHHHQSLDEMVDNQSVTSYATTTRDLTGRGIELPSPPKSAEDGKDFECPYCFIICPARYGQGRSWRTHLLQDLQPYICTYEECQTSDQLFRSRREWSDHEATHRKLWRCPEHLNAIYRSKSGLEDHLRQDHSGTIADNEIGSILKIGETSAIDARQKCPICLVDAEKIEGGMQTHVANHLERLASFALPKDIDTAEDTSEYASSVASGRRSGSSGSSQDLSTVSFRSQIAAPSDTVRSNQEEVTIQSSDPLNRLTAETLGNLPDGRDKRMDFLLADLHPAGDTDERKSHIEPPRAEALREHLMGLPGAQSLRSTSHLGLCSGHVTFKDSEDAAQAMQRINREQFPDLKTHIAPGYTVRLAFTLPDLEEVRSNRASSDLDTSGSASPGRTAFPETTPTPYTERPPSSGSSSDDESQQSSASVLNEREHKRRNGMPVLDPDELLSVESLYRKRALTQRDEKFIPNPAYNGLISLLFYDITRLQVDAIVNSANRSFKMTRVSDALCHSLHKAAGPGLAMECKSLGRAKVGQVRITSGYDLPAKFVLHAVRPQYTGRKGATNIGLLENCYRESLQLATAHNIRSIAFPTLGAGGCGFPTRLVAKIALEQTRHFLDGNPGHQFQRIIFCVYSDLSEKAYLDQIPVYFPPADGDVDTSPANILQSQPGEGKNVEPLREELDAVFLELEAVSASLSNFCVALPDFPHTVFEELGKISSALESLSNAPQVIFAAESATDKTEEDLPLLLSVLRDICDDIAGMIEQAKHVEGDEVAIHSTLWNDLNLHIRDRKGLYLHSILKRCAEFAHGLNYGILLGNYDAPFLKVKSIREELSSVQSKQNRLEIFGGVVHSREDQTQPEPQEARGIAPANIPSLSQLYLIGELEYRVTNAIPDSTVNHVVSLIREDLTKLQVDVIVNSTDMGFEGMGALDCAVQSRAGASMRAECAAFSMANEGDVKVTGGHQLPCRHVIHAVPPETLGPATKDLLRKCYRDALHIAVETLKARTVALPSIGTGMLGYPRREAAAIALEEVKIFLETFPWRETALQKIVFCVFGENDEFIYKAMLPLYFPPVDSHMNNAMPSGSDHSPKEEVPAASNDRMPRRGLFDSLGKVIGNIRRGKQNTRYESMVLDDYEEDTLITFESHAKKCAICSDLESIYMSNGELCVEGYGRAQAVLEHLFMKEDGNAYRARPIGQIPPQRVEMPSEFPLSTQMLRLTEKSYRDRDRNRPFVTVNESHADRIRRKRPLYPASPEMISDEHAQRPHPVVTIYENEFTVPTRTTSIQAESILAVVHCEDAHRNLLYEKITHDYVTLGKPGYIEVHPRPHEVPVVPDDRSNRSLFTMELLPSVQLKIDNRSVRVTKSEPAATGEWQWAHFGCSTPEIARSLFSMLDRVRSSHPMNKPQANSSLPPPPEAGPIVLGLFFGRVLPHVFDSSSGRVQVDETTDATDCEIFLSTDSIAATQTEPRVLLFRQLLTNHTTVVGVNEQIVIVRSEFDHSEPEFATSASTTCMGYRLPTSEIAERFHDELLEMLRRKRSRTEFPARGDTNSAIRSWTTKDIAEWLQQNGHQAEVIDKFNSSNVDGPRLLKLRADELYYQLGIQPLEAAQQILDQIEALRRGDNLADTTDPASPAPSGAELELPSPPSHEPSSTPAKISVPLTTQHVRFQLPPSTTTEKMDPDPQGTTHAYTSEPFPIDLGIDNQNDYLSYIWQYSDQWGLDPAISSNCCTLIDRRIVIPEALEETEYVFRIRENDGKIVVSDRLSVDVVKKLIARTTEIRKERAKLQRAVMGITGVESPTEGDDA